MKTVNGIFNQPMVRGNVQVHRDLGFAPISARSDPVGTEKERGLPLMDTNDIQVNMTPAHPGELHPNGGH